MNEEEMHDVNGGWSPFSGVWNAFDKARRTVVGKAIELVYTGVRAVVGVSKAKVIWAFCSEAKFIAGWKGVLNGIWINWKYVAIAVASFIGVALSLTYMITKW